MESVTVDFNQAAAVLKQSECMTHAMKRFCAGVPVYTRAASSVSEPWLGAFRLHMAFRRLLPHVEASRSRYGEAFAVAHRRLPEEPKFCVAKARSRVPA